jgi:acetyl-CoA carboxylase biotin carboxylase subunit
MLTSILIANRGEIARRIIRTCRKMGIRSIAVFSEADRQAPYVQEADTAFFLGDSSPAASYLNIDKLLQAANATGAQAIHPGYGFLAENAEFARKCREAGIVFIGPDPQTIETMGSKARAKAIMQEHQVPVIPGYQGEDQSEDKLLAEAEKIGFPVLLKASAGGGGKGMRIVHSKNESMAGLQAAKREAMKAFGDERLIIEKYFSNARHIEFQIFGDQQGNTLHLLERECSVQRRHQKILEESPSPVLDEELRRQMGEAALRAAKALNYYNAGTVEFILTETGEFYFLEVNTRLQVEHPVTEAVTGLDLVQLQIEVAEGKPLLLKQEDIKPNGYALECRLYAEDPAHDFRPDAGEILYWNEPQMEDLRIDSGVQSGSEVSVHYDPMLAKVIVHTPDRSQTFRKMHYALSQLQCLGVITNQQFLKNLLQDAKFIEGNYHTNILGSRKDLIPAAAPKGKNLPQIPAGWRNNYYAPQQDCFLSADEEIDVKYRYSAGNFDFQLNDSSYAVSSLQVEENKVSFLHEGQLQRFILAQKQETYFLHHSEAGTIRLEVKPRFPDPQKAAQNGGYKSSMPAEVVQVLVKAGDQVKAGQALVILSSMKMESTITAEEDGAVEEVFINPGEYIEAGKTLLSITN